MTRSKPPEFGAKLKDLSFHQKEPVIPEACGVELRYKLQMRLHPWDIFFTEELMEKFKGMYNGVLIRREGLNSRP
jgi:hypothetical protein